MDVFDFREHLVGEYEQFTRSFTRIRSDDIKAFVDCEYDSQRYWPEPLIQINRTTGRVGRSTSSSKRGS